MEPAFIAGFFNLFDDSLDDIKMENDEGDNSNSKILQSNDGGDDNGGGGGAVAVGRDAAAAPSDADVSQSVAARSSVNSSVPAAAAHGNPVMDLRNYYSVQSTGWYRRKAIRAARETIWDFISNALPATTEWESRFQGQMSDLLTALFDDVENRRLRSYRGDNDDYDDDDDDDNDDEDENEDSDDDDGFASVDISDLQILQIPISTNSTNSDL